MSTSSRHTDDVRVRQIRPSRPLSQDTSLVVSLMQLRIFSFANMIVVHSIQKHLIVTRQRHSSVIHLKTRYSVSSQVQTSSMKMERKLSLQEHLSRRRYSRQSLIHLQRRYLFVQYLRVSVRKVYVRSVMVSTSQLRTL